VEGVFPRAYAETESPLMTRRTNLGKILTSLNTPCPKCGYAIPPNETPTGIVYADALPEVPGSVYPRPEEIATELN
jgi:hypothetical protein